ncbi:MAG: uroporphyrinogen-III synthase [Paracoccaceae bacterium]|jgi:uroporphyrinogen-III synthase
MAYNPSIEILLIRPKAQSSDYAVELAQILPRRVVIHQSPLLEIAALDTPIDLLNVHHLLFTSINAVQAFTKLSDQRTIPALCVGDSTAIAAERSGMKVISAGGSALELLDLAIKTGNSLSGHFLYLRGVHVAKNITKDALAAGLEIRETTIYDQKMAGLDERAKRMLTGTQTTLVPFFSARSAEIFSDQTRDLSLRNNVAVCISKNVAQKLNAHEFLSVLTVEQPNSAFVTAVITREIATYV